MDDKQQPKQLLASSSSAVESAGDQGLSRWQLKRRSECLSDITRSSDPGPSKRSKHTFVRDDSDLTYGSRSKKKKVRRKKDKSSPDNKYCEKYADTSEYSWATRIKEPMTFKFDSKSKNESFEQSTETLDRYLSTLNTLFLSWGCLGQHPNPDPITPGSDRYKMGIRLLAMEHIDAALEQGRINESFKKKQTLACSSFSSDTSEAVTASRQDITKVNQTVKEGDVKWKVYLEKKDPGSSKYLPTFSSRPIDPKDNTFLHPALASLKPRSPSEPFLFFGVEVCATELDNIFNLESCGGSFKMVTICKRATKLLEFLKNLTIEWRNENENTKKCSIVKQIVCALRMVKESRYFQQRLIRLKSKDKLHRKFIEILLQWRDRETTFDEHHLQQLVCSIMNLDGNTLIKEKLYLNLFRKNPVKKLNITGPTSSCYPDILYFISDSEECSEDFSDEEDVEKKDVHVVHSTDEDDSDFLSDNDDFDDSDLEDKVEENPVKKEYANHCKQKKDCSTPGQPKLQQVPMVVCELKTIQQPILMGTKMKNGHVKVLQLRTELLWQSFEQLLACLLLLKLKKDKKVLYQGGLLIVENQVRTVVLAMSNEVYKKMIEFNDVKETLDHIRAFKTHSWCKLYIEKTGHRIWDVLSRAKNTYENFTER